MQFAKFVQISSESMLVTYSYIFNGFPDSMMPLAPASKSNLTAFTPYLTCMGTNYTEPYDVRCRGWYQNAVSTNDEQTFYFSKPYADSFTKEIIMSGSSQMIDQDTGELISVFGFDFWIQNLISFMLQNYDEGEDSLNEQYSVLFHEENNTVFYHRYWKSSDGVQRSWEDIEFNSTVNSPLEKEKFISQVTATKAFSETGDFSISNNINTDQFFQSCFSLVYPVEVPNLWEIYPSGTRLTNQALYLGRVHRDLRYILKTYSVMKDPTFIWVMVSESIVLFLLLSIFSLHYAAVLVHQVDQPILSLTRFLKRNLRRTVHASQTLPNQMLNTSAIQFSTPRQTAYMKSPMHFDKSPMHLDKSPMHLDKQRGTYAYDSPHMQSPKLLKSPNLTHIKPSQSPVLHFSIPDRPQPTSQPRGSLRLTQVRGAPSPWTSRSSRVITLSPYEWQTEEQENTKLTDVILLRNKSEINQNSTNLSRSGNLGMPFEERSRQISNSVDIESEASTVEKRQNVLDFDPMFEEIRIISQTFFFLQEVINYKSNHHNASASIADSILHYAHARQTFKLLKNTQGEVESLLNLASFSQQLVEVDQSSSPKVLSIQCMESVVRVFDIALFSIICEYNCSTFSELEQRLIAGTLVSSTPSESDYALLHCCLATLLSKATYMKEAALFRLSQYKEEPSFPLPETQNQYTVFYTYLQLSLDLFKQAIRVNQLIERVRSVSKNRKSGDFEFEKIMHIPSSQQSSGVKWELVEADIAEIEIHIGQSDSASARIEGLESLRLAPRKKGVSSFFMTKHRASTKYLQYTTPKHYQNYENHKEDDTEGSQFLIQSGQVNVSEHSDILSYRLTYLLGLEEMRRLDFKSAIQTFSSLFENWTIQDIKIQQKAKRAIKEILGTTQKPENSIFFEKYFGNKRYQYRQQKSNGVGPLDVIILIEESDIIHQFQPIPFSGNIPGVKTVAAGLNAIRNSVIDPQNDRIALITFKEKKVPRIVQPLASIQSQRLWDLTVDNVVLEIKKSLENDVNSEELLDYQRTNQETTLKVAIEVAFSEIKRSNFNFELNPTEKLARSSVILLLTAEGNRDLKSAMFRISNEIQASVFKTMVFQAPMNANVMLFELPGNQLVSSRKSQNFFAFQNIASLNQYVTQWRKLSMRDENY